MMEISGRIIIDGKPSAFLLTPKDGGWHQWDGDRSTLGERVDLLEKLNDTYREWASENLCTDCQDHLLDDGEGYDGRCGDCADRAETEDDQ